MSVGQKVTIVQTVQNIGVVNAPNTTVNTLNSNNLVVFTGSAVQVGTVQPAASVANLASLASASFTYVYTAGTAGPLQFSATASSLGFTSPGSDLHRRHGPDSPPP